MKRLAYALVAIFAGAAASAQTTLTSTPDRWSSDLTVYMFLPLSTKGTSTIAGGSAPINLDLGDALEVLNFAISGRYEAWKGDWGVIADANYLSIGESGAVGPLAVDVEATQWWLGFLGGYRAASGTQANGRPYAFDVQAGLRYTSIKQTIDLDGPGPGLSLGGTETWWEPVVGARYVWQISDRWSGGVLVDAGGFGVGGNDLAWSATLGFDLATRGSGSWKFGFRYYSIDFETERADGTFAYDIEQYGPIVGYTFRF